MPLSMGAALPGNEPGLERALLAGRVLAALALLVMLAVFMPGSANLEPALLAARLRLRLLARCVFLRCHVMLQIG